MGKAKKRSRRKEGARAYADYSKEMLSLAADLVRDKAISSYEAEKQFGIPRRTIVNKSKNIHSKPFGRPTELSTDEEAHIADVVNLAAEFGCPLTLLDLRIVVHNYLGKIGKSHLFKGKMPGERWARAFLDRYNFSQRATQNIKRSRAAKTVEEMECYYKNLETSLKDVPASNILNFDETNLSDDPGSKKCIFKRGTKHPERVINTSKSAVSIMFCGTADGKCLPPYVVYKADHLWSRWCENGPEGARYNRTKSGWFDMICFDDWFKTIVLPWAQSREGVKVIIGDNLASHLSVETIQTCQSQNIRFVFLPKNSTHLTQPLDVSFFGPMKRKWREILTSYKVTYTAASSINKCHFPQLLHELMNKIDITNDSNIRKGFEGAGIYPFDPSRVTMKLPTVQEENNPQFDASLLEFLQRNRRSQPIKSGQNRKLTVVPGKSISTEEAEEVGKAKNIKKDAKITKQKKKIDPNLPGPSNISTEEAEELGKAKNIKKDAKITKQKKKIDPNLPGPSNISTEEAEELGKAKNIKKDAKITKQKKKIDPNLPGPSNISSEDAEELNKAKNIKKDANITKQTKKIDLNLPGPSNINHAEANSPALQNVISSSIDTYEPDKDTALEHSSSIMLKNPDKLSSLCISAINIRLKPLAPDSEEFVHCLKDFPKNHKMNTPFYEDTPECLQLEAVNVPKNKIIITSNIVIKAASPEQGNILRDINTQINKRKRKTAGNSQGQLPKITSNKLMIAVPPEKRNILQDIDTQINTRKRTRASTSQEQSSKIKRKKKIVYNSDSSLSTETSFHAADDSDYENFDDYITLCLEDQKEENNSDQENICPFGLSNIDFFEEDSLGIQKDSWILVKFAFKKSVKHFIGKVLSVNNKIPTVKFVRKVKTSKCVKGTMFTYPNIEDVSTVQDLNDIILVLPDPQISRRGQLIFNLNLDKYNIQ